jgi:ribosomal protein L11 methyltransferase
MAEQAYQIIARGPRADAEAAATAMDNHAVLEMATYSIIEEDEDHDVWRIDAFPVSDDEIAALQDLFAGWPSLRVEQTPLGDADWLAMALSGLPPVRAGRFFIYGLHDIGRAPAGSVALRIEAGAAFGTGHHGTTTGCLIAYDRLIRKRRFDRVLDVGTGTGVLAIAAAHTGARTVVGTDIDRVSVRIARENARLNRARGRFVWADGLTHRAVAGAGPYDLVFANILARPLARLALPIRRALAPGGRVILSGLLRGQARFVVAAYRAKGFTLETRLNRDAWTTLVMK